MVSKYVILAIANILALLAKKDAHRLTEFWSHISNIFASGLDRLQRCKFDFNNVG